VTSVSYPDSSRQDNAIHFPGFDAPTQNYSKLPHALIDALPMFHTHGELAVVLYILRHTWGFSEYDTPKRISLDEFVNGRKRSNGTRMDSGCGASLSSVQRALKLAETHGFIVSETDDTDAGRIAKSYKLNMAHVQAEYIPTTTPVQSEQGGIQVEQGKPITPVQSEQSYIERNQEKETGREKAPPPPTASKPAPADVDAAVYDAPRTARAPQQFPDYGPRALENAALRAERSMQTTHPLYAAYAAQFETPLPAPSRADMAAAWWAEDYGYAPAHVAKATAQRLKSGRGGTAFKFIIQDLHTLLAGSGPLLQLVAAEAPAPVEAPAPAPRMSRAEVDALLNGAVDPEAKSA